MITAEPQRRAERIEEVLRLLDQAAAVEDRELLLQFAPIVLGETPDRLIFGHPASALAARTGEQFEFFARRMPAAHQFYKGLPGIHVETRNSEEARDDRRPKGRILRHETTIVEAHTMDAPFIFESLKNYFRKANLRVFSAIHPILSIRRQWERIVGIDGPQGEGTKELFCHFRVERAETKEQLRHIEHDVYSVLKCLFLAVEDFRDMRRVVQGLAPRLRSRHGKNGEVESARAFLEWLLDDNYIFMGTVCYRHGSDGRSHRVAESATGVFTDSTLLPVVFPGLMEEVETSMRLHEGDDRIIEIDYCNHASAIYHPEPIDDIAVRVWGPDGKIEETLLIQGRLAKGAFAEKSSDVPLLSEKQSWLTANSGATPKSFADREARAIFNRFPTRELFYADNASLKNVIDQLVYVTGDNDIIVNVRDGIGYAALYIAFSRIRYSYRIVQSLRETLSEAFGPISFSTSADLGATSLLLFYFESSKLDHPVEVEAVRHITEPLIKTWEDLAGEAIEEVFGEREGRRLLQRYFTKESRSGLYRESTPPEEVPEDIRHLDVLESRLEVAIVPRSPESITLKVFSAKSLGLTETLTTLQNLGLRVTEDLNIPLVLPGGRKTHLYRLEVTSTPEKVAALVDHPGRFVEALRALEEGRATDGNLNELVLLEGLSWREVDGLRTLRNHLLQIRPHYNAMTVNAVLLRNSAATAALFRYFRSRFDPDLAGDREQAMAGAADTFQKALEGVRSLVDDEVLRGFDNLIKCCVRTNFYQRPERPVISVKVASQKVESMPSPRPMYEVYVHSPRLEGVHLRGGKVARGGLRWSDRHDDFRTEILGLMKTQVIKNSIIVPVGSKGGFILTGEVPQRPALDAYLVDRYREFIAGLLDVTDNRIDGEVIHPPDVVRYDEPDPYLVVAADKGTAHLSDVANAVSQQYGLWLGDAFASGGRHGYDHKKVGITARGAWECVRHHFYNLGIDVQKDPFTVAGIGDMSGDVFGNGMLLSRVIKLVAAFNHVHIFLDPSPDPQTSYQERERLFHTPRTTWLDYDAAKISVGGGVFDRSAKRVPLSAQVRNLLDIDAEYATGEEVVRRILTARVDLLYNGGIGTYVKASNEEHADVGDRTNDSVRVNAEEVRARVVGEGGNLGFTQAARLAFWARGGLVNTDAIDNSGGVDISDHEVNMKILMEMMIKNGKLSGGLGERNEMLAEMTEEVADLVLADNRAQARALTLDGIRSAAAYEEFVSLIDDMEGAGLLLRAEDAVPTRDELLASDQRERGLPLPLLALMLGQTKIRACELVLGTEVPESEECARFLKEYFPVGLRHYAEEIERHPLRREIVATLAVNYVINLTGASFLARVMAATEAGIDRVITTYLAIDRESEAPDARREAEKAGRPAAQTHTALTEIEAKLEDLTIAALRGAAASATSALTGVRERFTPEA